MSVTASPMSPTAAKLAASSNAGVFESKSAYRLNRMKTPEMMEVSHMNTRISTSLARVGVERQETMK